VLSGSKILTMPNEMETAVRRLILRSFQSPGDVVMLSAAVRDLHAARAGEFQTDVRTSADAIWEHNPHITPLREREPGVETLDMHYPLIHQSNQRPYHFIHGYVQYLEERLGVRIAVTGCHGDVHLSQEEKEAALPHPELYDVGSLERQQLGATGASSEERSAPAASHIKSPGREHARGERAPSGEPSPRAGSRMKNFWIVVAGGKYDFTAKWWNPASFQKVVDALRGRVHFVQCGEEGHWHPRLEGVTDLVGKTSLREFIRLVYHADGVLSPVTLAMHLAAAVETRPGKPGNRACVVVAGGREPAHWEAYSQHQFISTNGALPCCAEGGCWRSRCQLVGDGDGKDRRNVCRMPVQVSEDLRIARCMEMIRPEDVIRRIELYYEGGALRYENGRGGEGAEGVRG